MEQYILTRWGRYVIGIEGKLLRIGHTIRPIAEWKTKAKSEDVAETSILSQLIRKAESLQSTV